MHAATTHHLQAMAPPTQVLRSGGLGPLVRLLQHTEEEVQANAAGAIQSICFQVRLPASAPLTFMAPDSCSPWPCESRAPALFCLYLP